MLGDILKALHLTDESCTVCGNPVNSSLQGYLCDDCLGELKPAHPIEYKPLEYVSSYRVFGRYEGVLKECLQAVKFKGAVPLARTLGIAIRESLSSFVSETRPDLVTFVPTHLFRFWRRGFDHNAEILKGADVEAENLLVRVRYSKPFASLSKEERFKRAKGSFRVKKDWIDRIEDKRILVFDDILTSGATSTSVAEELLTVGAREVHFFFVAKD